MISSSTERTLSCGLLITSPEGWLLAHATRTPRWDLPKGKIEDGETPLEAALRETLEETGLDMAEQRAHISDLGRHSYLPRKDLHLFRLDLDQALDLSGCGCSTYVQRGNGTDRYLETDAYAWVAPDQIVHRVGKSLMAYFVERGLLTAPPAPRAGRPAHLKRV